MAYAKNMINPSEFVSCSTDLSMQTARSLELKTLVDADQKAREGWENMSEDEAVKLFQEDKTRRKRVGEIFGEGCFKTAQDYASAALIYQHGDVPDHYYQAFIWANQAVRLGDVTQKHLAALAIDRYLVSIGKKQLFGSQASYGLAVPNKCYCIEPVENTFPDAIRLDYLGKTLSEQYSWIELLNQKQHCQTTECQKTLEPSPVGTVPGFW